jgi:hypothetical protein
MKTEKFHDPGSLYIMNYMSLILCILLRGGDFEGRKTEWKVKGQNKCIMVEIKANWGKKGALKGPSHEIEVSYKRYKSTESN